MSTVRYLCPICLGICTVTGYRSTARRSFICEDRAKGAGKSYIFCDISNSCEECSSKEVCDRKGTPVRISEAEHAIKDDGQDSRWCRPNYSREGHLEI